MNAINDIKCSVGVVLGSGQSGFVDCLDDVSLTDFADISGMPLPTGSLHPGKIAIAKISAVNSSSSDNGASSGGAATSETDKYVMASVGRLHPYDGLSAKQVIAPIELMATHGVRKVILCNAAGAINPNFAVGELVQITDQINLTGMNPLITPSGEPATDAPAKSALPAKPTFPDMEDAYSPSLIEKVSDVCASLGIGVKRGVYMGVLGPSFETPAEIRAFGKLGADLVGMSTVLEVIAARAMNIEVAGLSAISNMACGVSKSRVTVEDITKNMAQSNEKLFRLLTALLPVI